MNKYEIEVKEMLKKKLTINAESPKEALDLIERIYLTSNILEFKPDEIEEVEVKILAENGMKIENLEELNEEEFEENELDDYEDEEKLLENYSIEDLEEIFEKVKEKIVRNDKNSIKFKNKINNIFKEYNELIELVMDEEID